MKARRHTTLWACLCSTCLALRFHRGLWFGHHRADVRLATRLQSGGHLPLLARLGRSFCRFDIGLRGGGRLGSWRHLGHSSCWRPKRHHRHDHRSTSIDLYPGCRCSQIHLGTPSRHSKWTCLCPTCDPLHSHPHTWPHHATFQSHGHAIDHPATRLNRQSRRRSSTYHCRSPCCSSTHRHIYRRQRGSACQYLATVHWLSGLRRANRQAKWVCHGLCVS